MRSDRERVEALERSVRLLADALSDALEALADHQHGDGEAPRLAVQSALNKALGRLDAVLSSLGVGEGGRTGSGGGGANGEG